MPLNHNVIKKIISKLNDIYAIVGLRRLSKYWCMYLDNNKELEIDKFLNLSFGNRSTIDMIKSVILDSEKIYILRRMVLYFWKDNRQIMVGDIDRRFLDRRNIATILYFTLLKYVRMGLEYRLFNSKGGYGTFCIK